MAKRIITLFLVVIMLATVFCSCADNGENEKTTTAGQEEATTAGGEGEVTSPSKEDIRAAEIQKLIDVLPNEKYDGEFLVLARTEIWTNSDFDAEEYLGELLNDARYDRISAVEEKYGIDIVNEYANDTEMTNRILQSFMVDCDFDIALGGIIIVSKSAQGGFLKNLYNIDTLDLETCVWDQKCIEELTIQKCLYTVTGDASIQPLQVTFGVLFSKTYANNLGINDLYDLVADKEWTIDKMITYAANAGADSDGIPGLTKEDTYGIILSDESVYCAISGSMCNIAKVNADGEVVDTFENARMSAVLDNYFSWVYNDNVFHYQREAEAEKARRNMFYDNRVLFNITYLVSLDAYREEMTDPFGILPYPMFDTDVQKDYSSYVHLYGCAAFVVPRKAPDLDKTGVILQAIAAYSGKYLTPAYYDTALVSRSVRDNESSASLDIMRDNRTYEVSKALQLGGFADELIILVRGRLDTYVSSYKNYKKKIKTQINTINEDFANNADD